MKYDRTVFFRIFAGIHLGISLAIPIRIFSSTFVSLRITSKFVKEPSFSTINCIKDIRISDHGNWRHLHWNALQSAYGESPFFDYYQDDIRPFFEQRWDYLLDFNEAIREKMCELLDIQPKVDYSKKFTVYSLSSCVPDYRMVIRPKNPEPDPDFTPKRYYQVYEQKHGFLPNLSILDLLFNMGPESIFYL